jgi:hypothetical protein
MTESGSPTDTDRLSPVPTLACTHTPVIRAQISATPDPRVATLGVFPYAVFPQQNHCGALISESMTRAIQAHFFQKNEIFRLDTKKTGLSVNLAVMRGFFANGKKWLAANRGKCSLFLTAGIERAPRTCRRARFNAGPVKPAARQSF